MPRRGRTAWDRWTAAGAPWPSRSLSPTRTTDDDALEEAGTRHGAAGPAIAGDGVDRGGQRRDRLGIKARAIEPAAPSGLTGRWQGEQGGVAWPMTSWPRRRAVRISEPRLYQASSSRHEGADRAQHGHGDLTGVARTSAQAGDQRHRAIPARHHERDEALAQQEHRPVGLGRVIEADRDTGRLSRGARRQRVVDNGKAPPLPDLPSDNPAQRRYQAEQPEPFEHPVCQPSRGVSARIACVTSDASRAPTINSTSVSRPASGLDCTISPTHLQRVAGNRDAVPWRLRAFGCTPAT